MFNFHDTKQTGDRFDDVPQVKQTESEFEWMTMSGTRISGLGYSGAVRVPSGGTNKPTDTTQLRGTGTEGTDINGFARTKLRNGRKRQPKFTTTIAHRPSFDRDEVDRRSLEAELV